MDTPRHQTTAAVLLRVGAILIIVTALWQSLANTAESVFEIDPSYLGYYFRQNLLRPLIGLALGVVLFVFAGPLARRCAPVERTGP
ncbi:MAG: hypothetical protein JJU00_08270 [Opitutales bacterium]|nr:hypothetical protein [Opitutales bacterium]